jgi:crotonobetainyl-CoA:carnitine CoA-transferase CaiB-like acyl-CoA transferase
VAAPSATRTKQVYKVETEAGILEALEPPARSDSFKASVTKVPALGENSRAILEELGYTDKEIDVLAAARVI